MFKKKLNFNKKITLSYALKWQLTLFAFIVIGLFLPYFNIITFLLMSYLILFKRNDDFLFELMFFLFPFALIFKIPPLSLSLYTILTILICLKITVTKFKIHLIFLIPFIFLFTFCCFNDMTLSLDNIKNLINIYFLYLFIRQVNGTNRHKYIYAFILSLLFSTSLSLFKESIPNFLGYYDELNYVYNNGVAKLRFSGIFSDPNYFSIYLVIAICCSLYLIDYKKHIKINVFLIITFLLFGFFTYSKSFYIIAVLLLAFTYFKKLDVRNFIFVTILGVSLISIYFINPFGIFDTINTRFFSGGSFLTGRNDIWNKYLVEIFSSDYNIVFGHGLGAGYVNEKAAHSFIIEMLYYFGFFGSFIYIVTIISTFLSNKDKKFKYKNFDCMIYFILMYLFLCGVKAYELCFYLGMIYILITYEKGVTNGKINN